MKKSYCRLLEVSPDHLADIIVRLAIGRVLCKRLGIKV